MQTTGLRWRLRPRVALAIGSSLLALVLAVAAALGSESTPSQLNGFELIGGWSTNSLAHLAVVLPLGYAFAAGMVSALNPCGFALVPTYLGLYLGSDETGGLARRLGRAGEISLVVTASFVTLFGAVGLLVGATSSVLVRLFPWIGLAAGLALIAAGAAIFAGAQLYSSLGQRLGAQLGERATRGGIAGYAAYGLAYGACSLGCTLPVFLTVLGSALVAGGPVGAAGDFLLYGLGMGAVLSALTVAVALLKRVGFSRLRRLGVHLQTAAAVLLLATGAYVVYYWLTLGGILSRGGAPA
ncbi:MAG TPA: cytochrome c biogenesis protein CcdA [Candidatus Dormibacteraeota bacterium]|nr:cytochrome c biogenesis protein CcdA [Candidatus Dormibacteraeota bacterium]